MKKDRKRVEQKKKENGGRVIGEGGEGPSEVEVVAKKFYAPPFNSSASWEEKVGSYVGASWKTKHAALR